MATTDIANIKTDADWMIALHDLAERVEATLEAIEVAGWLDIEAMDNRQSAGLRKAVRLLTGLADDATATLRSVAAGADLGWGSSSRMPRR